MCTVLSANCKPPVPALSVEVAVAKRSRSCHGGWKRLQHPSQRLDANANNVCNLQVTNTEDPTTQPLHRNLDQLLELISTPHPVRSTSSYKLTITISFSNPLRSIPLRIRAACAASAPFAYSLLSAALQYNNRVKTPTVACSGIWSSTAQRHLHQQRQAWRPPAHRVDTLAAWTRQPDYTKSGAHAWRCSQTGTTLLQR